MSVVMYDHFEWGVEISRCDCESAPVTSYYWCCRCGLDLVWIWADNTFHQTYSIIRPDKI